MTKMPSRLAASIPANTGVETLRRAIFAAPSAQTSGARPAMKAIDVIITARNRSFAPVSAASMMLRLGIPFIFATGYGDTAMIPERMRGLPIVRKPYSIDSLRGALSAMLDDRE